MTVGLNERMKSRETKSRDAEVALKYLPIYIPNSCGKLEEAVVPGGVGTEFFRIAVRNSALLRAVRFHFPSSYWDPGYKVCCAYFASVIARASGTTAS